MAGVRTITLVVIGSFLFVSISELTTGDDITRVAAQVVSGIGFLGAGVILRDGANIRGLNTDATLWCSAAIGTLIALGLLVEAIIGVAYILLSNLFLTFVSRKIMKKISPKAEHYSLIIQCDIDKETYVKKLLIQKLTAQRNFLNNFSTRKGDNLIAINAQVEILNNVSNSMNEIVNSLCIESGVNSANYARIVNYDDDDDYEEK